MPLASNDGSRPFLRVACLKGATASDLSFQVVCTSFNFGLCGLPELLTLTLTRERLARHQMQYLASRQDYPAAGMISAQLLERRGSSRKKTLVTRVLLPTEGTNAFRELAASLL